MHLRALSPLLLLPVLAAALPACDFDAPIGGGSATAGETGETGDETDGGETGETDGGETDGETGEDGGTGAVGESGDGIECPTDEIVLGYSDEDPSGMTAKVLFGDLEDAGLGTLVYDGGDATELGVEVFYDGGFIRALHTSGEVEGCSEHSLLLVDAMMSLASADGLFNEVIPVTLARSSAVPESVEFSAHAIDATALHGDYEPPPAIGPEGFAPEDFAALRLDIHGVFGPPRPMFGPGEKNLGDVHGAIYGQGELSEWSCPDEPGQGCMGSLRDFFVGHFIFDL